MLEQIDFPLKVLKTFAKPFPRWILNINNTGLLLIILINIHTCKSFAVNNPSKYIIRKEFPAMYFLIVHKHTQYKEKLKSQTFSNIVQTVPQYYILFLSDDYFKKA
jgi:hypothetical protein